MRCKKSFLPILVALLSQASVAGECLAEMESGFCWPTGKDNPRITTKHLAHGSDRGGTYFSGSYHLGVDIPAKEDSKVYPVADGVVISKSFSGWTGNGTKNYALLVRHKIKDGKNGTAFIALYGHMKVSGKEYSRGDKISVTDSIGVIGSYPRGGDHLHFSIWPDKSTVPTGNYGLVYYQGTKDNPNAPWPKDYGQTYPIKFLKEHEPFKESEPEPDREILTLRRVGDVAWYPNNVTCMNAQRWFEVHRVTPVVDPKSEYAWSYQERGIGVCSGALFDRYPGLVDHKSEIDKLLFGKNNDEMCQIESEL